MTSFILVVLFVIVLTIGASALFCTAYFTCKAIKEVKPGVNIWSIRYGCNPCNVILFSKNLTEEGLLYRKKMYSSLVRFVISMIIGLSIGIIARVAP